MRIKLPLAEHIHLNESLPWDVLDSAGTLLLRKGTLVTDPRRLCVLIERGAYVDKEEYERHAQDREPQAPPPPAPPPSPLPSLPEQISDPFPQWDNVRLRLGTLLHQQLREPQFAEQLTQLTQDIRRLVETNADAAIFAMSRLDRTHATDPSLESAVACEIYGRFLRWSEQDRASLINAALTMNVAILDLQLTLETQRDAPSLDQLERIRRHPEQGFRQLSDLGVSDQNWLQTVLQHHESPDGTGYPAGVTALNPAAEVLNVADRYCALLRSRSSRDTIVSGNATRDLCMLTSGKLRTVVAGMIKAYGLYPPGYFVSLANGEIAVVVRRGEHANKPRVSSLVGARGTKLTVPIVRDTAVAEFAIAKALPLAAPVSIDPSRLYGYKADPQAAA